MATSYKKVFRNVAIGLFVTIVGGLVVARFSPLLQSSTDANGQTHVSGESSSNNLSSTRPSITSEPSQPPPSTKTNVQVAPAPLNNTIITDSRVTVVGKKISPAVWSAENPPGYYTSVFTAAGEISSNAACYVHWSLYNNGVLLNTDDTNCGLEGGWSTAYWPNTTRLDPGTVKVTASITTDWGATASPEADFTVQ